MEPNIDFSRRELRYFLPINSTALLMEEIKKHFSQKIFSGNQIVQTVYFNNDEQLIPWGVSLKARRYLPDYLGNRFCLKQKEKFYCSEFKKRGSDPELREKRREFSISLKEATENFSQELGLDLRPYFFVEYYRQHFVPKADIPMRLTIDSDIRYYYCDRRGIVHFLKRDAEIARIELKTGKEDMEGNLVKNILSFFDENGAQPIISKKEEGLNLIKAYFDKTHSCAPFKELRDCEIEAKLLFSGTEPERFFVNLRKSLQADSLISIDERYPFTFTTTSINHYWRKEDGNEGVKLLFKGAKVRPVLKRETIVVDADLGIIKREEFKGEKFTYSSEHLQKLIKDYSLSLGPLIYAGYLVRGRKAIWPEHKKSGRIYHISLDCCSAGKKTPLYQLEVEYSGRRESKCPNVFDEAEARKAIIADIQSLTTSILLFAMPCNGVVVEPHTLSKFDWLTK